VAVERQGGWALARRRSTVAMGVVKGTRGVRILFVRRHRDGELDREGAAVATRCARCLRAPRQLGGDLDDAHPRCQQRRMKQRRCARPCSQVRGACIVVAPRLDSGRSAQ
jgi:hypothetical protein